MDMRAGRHDGCKLYLDFDGYFAAVEEQAAPALHGRPVAVLPHFRALASCPGEKCGLRGQKAGPQDRHGRDRRMEVRHESGLGL